jgi:methyl-accepting chemotaxis protein
LVSWLGIRTRTFGGFGILIALLAALGAIASIQINRLSVTIVQNEHAAAVADAVADIGHSAERVQASTQGFLLSRKSADIVAATEAAANLSQAVARADEAMGNVAAAPWHVLQQAIGGYITGLDRIIAAISAERRAIDELGHIGPIIGVVADALAVQAKQIPEPNRQIAALHLQSALQGGRIAASRFMLARQPADRDNAAQERARMGAALAELTDVAATRNQPGTPGQRVDDMIAFVKQNSRVFTNALDSAVAATMERQTAEEGLASAAGQLDSARRNLGLWAVNLREHATRHQAETIVTLRKTLAIASVASLIIGGFLAWLIARSIVRPVQAMTATMQQLAAGDLAVAVPAIGHHDEIGRMALALDVFRANAQQIRTHEAAVKAREWAVAEERRRELDSLAQAFESNVLTVAAALSKTASEVKTAFAQQVYAADESSNRAALVASASQNAITDAEAVAAATEQLSSSIYEIAQQAKSAANLVEATTIDAQVASRFMADLHQTAQRIGAVTQLIGAIAGQTNLLSLNATIEAARAGEMGKGFAVVASEVKMLANRSAQATQEIQSQIAALRSDTEQVGAAIGAMLKKIQTVSQISASIAAAVQQQGVATQAISQNIQNFNTMTSDVAHNIALVAQSSGVVKAQAEATRGASAALLESAEQLTGKTARFLTSIATGTR